MMGDTFYRVTCLSCQHKWEAGDTDVPGMGTETGMAPSDGSTWMAGRLHCMELLAFLKYKLYESVDCSNFDRSKLHFKRYFEK